MRYPVVALVVLFALAGPLAAADLQPAAGEILVRGLVASVSGQEMTVTATAVRAAGAAQDTILKERVAKQVLIAASTQILLNTGAAGSREQLVPGAEVAVAGPNKGKGAALPARAIMVFLPDRAPAGAGQPEPDAVPAAPAGGAASTTKTPSAAWAKWNDPAGFSYEYPKDWTASATPGANPVSFVKDAMVLSVRRLPVEQGNTPPSRALTAMQAASAAGARQGWQVTETRTRIAGQNGFKLTMRGKMTGQQIAQLLGARPASGADGAEGIINLIYAGTPVNTGRESFALEIGIASPAAQSYVGAEVLSQVQRSLTLGAAETKEAPGHVTPMRVANTVQIENAMRQIGTAMQMFFVEYDDVVPPNWTALEPYLGGAYRENIRNGWPNWQVGPIQLLQPGKRLSDLGNPASTPVARADGPGFSVVLYADGHIQKQARR